MSELFLGIDTSNYKTSIAVTNTNGDILIERSEYLNVPTGEKGLRQSDAFFQQSNNIPEFIETVFNNIKPEDIKAVGVSTQPRRIEGSYMPCFLAGLNAANIISNTLNIPIYHYSHQEGHAAAVIEHNDSSLENERCLFFHLSGGTTEFLLCERDDMGYKMEILGGTKDISFGQLLDRIGVAMDYPFPSGAYMDNIAFGSLASKNIIPLIKISDSTFNLSGIETFMLRYIDNHNENEINSVIAELFQKISELIFKSAMYLAEKYNIKTVYIAGGVASSKTIREAINKSNKSNIRIEFVEPKLSGDNAIGISYLAGRTYKNR